MSEATWIWFEELAPNVATKRWAVQPIDGGDLIGMVKWHGPWRKYCFFPMADTVFEQTCLRDLANFCESETRKHREAKNKI